MKQLSNNRTLKKITSWLTNSLSIAIAALNYAPSTSAQKPFACDGDFFLSQKENTQLTTVNTSTTPFRLPVISFPAPSTTPREYNAMGFRVQDGFIYAIEPGDPVRGIDNPADSYEIFRIDRKGTVTPIGKPLGLPLQAPIPNTNNRYIAGDFSGDGTYYIYNNNTGKLVQIDVTKRPPQILQVRDLQRPGGGFPKFSDMAYSPVDGKFYAYDQFEGRLLRFDPEQGSTVTVEYLNGVTNPIGNRSVGATFFDGAGTLYAYQNEPGLLYSVNVLDTPVKYTFLSNAPSVDFNDGAACPFVPRIIKTVDPPSVIAGNNVTYTYLITNPNPPERPITGLTITDTMANGRKFLEPPHVKIVRGQGGSTGNVILSNDNRTFTITGLTLPAANAKTVTPGQVEITAKVNVPVTTPPGTVFNQAIVRNFPGGSFPDSIGSDFPGAGAVPDPTPLVVLAPASPVGTKSVRLFEDVDEDGSVTRGDILEYVVTYINNSSTNVTNFVATDTLDASSLQLSGGYDFNVSGPLGTTVAANPSFNGTTIPQLNKSGILAANGGQVTIKFQAKIVAGPGVAVKNQAVAIADAGPGVQTPSVTDAVGGSGEIPQELDDGEDGGNLPGTGTGDDEPTIVVVQEPNTTSLFLVKRITNVVRDGISLPGVDFQRFVDNKSDPNDTVPGWSASLPFGLLTVEPDNTLQSGDFVEYTIYFLASGSQAVENVKICDAVPQGTTYVPSSISLTLPPAGSQSIAQTDAKGDDAATFVKSLDLSSPFGSPPCLDSKNINGSLVVDLGSTLSNSNPRNVGSVSFRVKVN
ncbi:MAG: hypothetical protein WA999_19875 [Spirulinaceae cyanobacterium]